MRQRIRGLLVAFVLIGLTGVYAGGAELTRTTIALTGEPAPGRAATFTNVGAEAAIRDGAVAFIAETSDSGVYRHGIWVERGAGLERAVFDRDVAAGPGYAETVFAPSSLDLNAGGDVAFKDMHTSESVWHDGALASVASDLMIAPGPVGEAFWTLSGPSIDSGGHIAFRASLSSQKGIWTNAFAGGLQALAVTGQAAPGGGTYTAVGDPRLGEGRVVYTATVSDGSSRAAVVAYTASGEQLVARVGDAVPGMPGYTYSWLPSSMGRDIVANGLGQAAMIATVSSAAGAKMVIMAEGGAGLAPVVQAGQAAPGGGTYFSISHMAFNDSGRLAFAGFPGGSGGAGWTLWSNGIDGTFRMVVSDHQVLPDIPGAPHMSLFQDIALSETGMTAFSVIFNLPEAPLSTGLFAQDARGELHLVAYEGQSVLPAPGLPARTIARIDFGGPRAVSGDTLIYSLSFTDGTSGVYTTTVPEPASLAMLLGVGAAMLTRRRR